MSESLPRGEEEVRERRMRDGRRSFGLRCRDNSQTETRRERRNDATSEPQKIALDGMFAFPRVGIVLMKQVQVLVLGKR